MLNTNVAFEGRPIFEAVDAVVYAGAGLLTLLIGSWIPDARIDISGVPLGLAMMVMALLLLPTATMLPGELLRGVIILQLPLLILCTTLFWSADVPFGIEKASTLILSGTVAFLLFSIAIDRVGLKTFCALIACMLAGLLIVAVLYKLRAGFFDRKVSFFVSGPIVFARLMAIGCLLSIFAFRGVTRLIAIVVFAAAVFWAQSKGPVLALFVTLLAYVFHALGKGWRFVVVGVVGAGLVIGVYLLETRAIDLEALGRLAVLVQIVSGDTSVISDAANVGSLGVRFEMWKESIDLLVRAPFGVGLGGWATGVTFYSDMSYPHNLILELLNEGGILIGTFALIPFCIFLFGSRNNIYYFCAFFLLIAQMFSGDLGDARFLLVFSFLAFFVRPQADTRAT